MTMMDRTTFREKMKDACKFYNEVSADGGLTVEEMISWMAMERLEEIYAKEDKHGEH